MVVEKKRGGNETIKPSENIIDTTKDFGFPSLQQKRLLHSGSSSSHHVNETR